MKLVGMGKPDRRAEVFHVFNTPEITDMLYQYMDSLPLCSKCGGWGGGHQGICPLLFKKSTEDK